MYAIRLFSVALLIVMGSSIAFSAKDKSKGKKQKEVTVSLEASQQEVHDALVHALVSIGCNIKKDTPSMVQGKRPNKMGALVGSGGEIITGSINAGKNGKVSLTVKTKKTMVGMAGQKLWSAEVVENVQKALK